MEEVTEILNAQFTRNLGTLSLEEQVAISKTKIAIAGCGLGSEVARQLARFGFTITALADPDTVEIHNLNRQHYHHDHIGLSKVEALADNLKKINPHLQPLLYKEGITTENYEEFASKGDIIIDAIDPSALHLSVALTRAAHRLGKPVVTAVDFGFGARIFIFPPDGIEITDFLGIDRHTTDEAILQKPIVEIMGAYMTDTPEYVLQILDSFVTGNITFYPQNMLAVAQSGIMVTAACKRLTLGQPVISAPDYVHVDLDLMLKPTV